MLSEVFHGSASVLESYQLQFLPLERVDWGRLVQRHAISNASRFDDDRVSQRANYTEVYPYRPIGEHPLFYELTKGLATRDLVKGILLLLFPTSFVEGCRSTEGGDAVMPQSSSPRPPTAASPRSASLRAEKVRRLHSAKDLQTAAALRRASNTITKRVELDDVVPLDEGGTGILSLDPPQLLCYLFMPHAYLSRTDPQDDLHSSEFISRVRKPLFRAARSLCRWTVWAVKERRAQILPLEAVESFFFSTVAHAAALATPLMFPKPTATKMHRFMELRGIGPQSLVAFLHMLSTFLEDTFETAFTSSAVVALQQSIATTDADEFVEALDAWRFLDGVHHVERLMAAFPTPEDLARALPSSIVVCSELMLPTAAHKETLEKDIASLPRRTVSSVAYTLLHAAIPLGSVAEVRRTIRAKDQATHRSTLSASLGATLKYALPPGWLDAHSASPPTKCVSRRTNSSAVSVWKRMERVDVKYPVSTLEKVVLDRHMSCTDSHNATAVAYTASTQAARQLLRDKDRFAWQHERHSVTDFRPLNASSFANEFGTSFLQLMQDERAHEFDRNRRAVERLQRRSASQAPRLDCNVAELVALCQNRDPTESARGVEDCPVGVHPATKSDTGAALAERARRIAALTSFDASESGAAHPPLHHFSKKELFCWLHDGIAPVNLREA